MIRQFLTASERLLRDADGGRPYLVDDQSRAIPLDTDGLALQATLAATGINPSEASFQWLLADLRTAAANEGQAVPLTRWAAADGQTVRMSAGASRFVVADAQGLHLVDNGTAGVVFAADAAFPEWQPAPVVDPFSLAVFNPPLQAPPEAPGYTPAVQRELLGAWLAGLAAGIRPLPILAILGPKDGGKSWLARAILRTFLGPTADVVPLNEDPRDFQTLAVNQVVMCLDNVDDPENKDVKWLPDALATLATGGRWQGRQFFTKADVFDRPYTARVIITSRTATFARVDVAERILPIFTAPLPDNRRVADSDLTRELLTHRDGLLSWAATVAAKMLGMVGQAPAGLPARFLDFARLVWAYHAIDGRAADTIPALLAWRQAQSLAVGDADPLVAAILEYGTAVAGRTLTPADLVRELTRAGADIPLLGGGKRIAKQLRELRSLLKLAGWQLAETSYGHGVAFMLSRVP